MKRWPSGKQFLLYFALYCIINRKGVEAGAASFFDPEAGTEEL
jgi:hypothetical protein